MMTLADLSDDQIIQLFNYAQDPAQLDAIEAEMTRRGIGGRRDARRQMS